jgi:hypothetical protein
MNLTKGKISKLYSKKKQSLKRNKRGHSGKSKTFRKNRRVNLARKSLKRLHFKENKGGGVNDNELPKETTDNKEVDDYVANIASNDDTKAEPSPVIGSPFKSPPETSTEPSFESPEFGDTTPSESSSAVDETPSETTTVEETPAPTVDETPAVNTALDESTVEETTAPPAVEETTAPPAVEETTALEETTPSPSVDPTVEETPLAPTVDETPAVEETPSVEETTNPAVESTNNEDPELTSAINNVVSLITEKVTKKVSEEVNANSVDAAQNGFKEIDETARIMGSSGGGKKSKPNKSRKFKLTRKNKTRRRRSMTHK